MNCENCSKGISEEGKVQWIFIPGLFIFNFIFGNPFGGNKICKSCEAQVNGLGAFVTVIGLILILTAGLGFLLKLLK
ncbi:MAG: hypothetical protein HY283_09450 [Nitrospirae bacterium]|nr:hypothetical protein [Nitrospirota bacterium]